jgi:hypothetical protein
LTGEVSGGYLVGTISDSETLRSSQAKKVDWRVVACLEAAMIAHFSTDIVLHVLLPILV